MVAPAGVQVQLAPLALTRSMFAGISSLTVAVVATPVPLLVTVIVYAKTYWFLAGSVSFFVTDVPDRFVRVGQRFLGAQVESVVRIER